MLPTISLKGKKLFLFVEDQMYAIYQKFLSSNKLCDCTFLYYEYKFFKIALVCVPFFTEICFCQLLWNCDSNLRHLF